MIKFVSDLRQVGSVGTSVRLRRLKTYARSTMKNDRLSSLGLMHILTEILKWTCTKQKLEVFVSAKTRRADFGQF